MKVHISRAAAEAIRSEAERSGAQECCGLLLSSDRTGRIDDMMPARNVAADPRIAFEIDPAALIGAYRAERAGGPAILGCYHSHPTGDARPSRQDAALAELSGRLWLICGGRGGTMTLWIARAGGAVHGAFDPVDMVQD